MFVQYPVNLFVGPGVQGPGYVLKGYLLKLPCQFFDRLVMRQQLGVLNLIKAIDLLDHQLAVQVHRQLLGPQLLSSF